MSFSAFTKLWHNLPKYIQIRVPKKVFETSTDGYNLGTLQKKCFDHILNESLGGSMADI